MSDLAALKAQLPIDQIAAQVGSDPASTSAAIDQLLPALVGGLDANAADPAGAASLEKALGSHRNGLLDGGVDPAAIDTADGQQIVSNIFGANTDQVVSRLGGQSGGNDLVKKLLPILAPIVLSWLASRLGGQGGPAQSGTGGLGDILGDLLGGGAASPQAPAPQAPAPQAPAPQAPAPQAPAPQGQAPQAPAPQGQAPQGQTSDGPFNPTTRPAPEGRFNPPQGQAPQGQAPQAPVDQQQAPEQNQPAPQNQGQFGDLLGDLLGGLLGGGKR